MRAFFLCFHLSIYYPPISLYPSSPSPILIYIIHPLYFLSHSSSPPSFFSHASTPSLSLSHFIPPLHSCVYPHLSLFIPPLHSLNHIIPFHSILVSIPPSLFIHPSSPFLCPFFIPPSLCVHPSTLFPCLISSPPLHSLVRSLSFHLRRAKRAEVGGEAIVSLRR